MLQFTAAYKETTRKTARNREEDEFKCRWDLITTGPANRIGPGGYVDSLGNNPLEPFIGKRTKVTIEEIL